MVSAGSRARGVGCGKAIPFLPSSESIDYECSSRLAAPIVETDSYHGPAYPTNSWGFRTNVTVLNNLTVNAFGEWQRGAWSHSVKRASGWY